MNLYLAMKAESEMYILMCTNPEGEEVVLVCKDDNDLVLHYLTWIQCGVDGKDVKVYVAKEIDPYSILQKDLL